eukprot:gnl/TRDRNA2_/TRDRNA2_83080_c0_seq1.p1 gnl/TRDRNA2_/TRDRNA2_83080_c0~~gnl/TRDRNA2_/TRDRNA2_83080_c0_seq1.p1  ORF type:complete len:362 (+),score=40.37 gnl/TRDRNA2_/TRDRNA2_83080_c0_seq1:172-1257(+)
MYVVRATCILFAVITQTHGSCFGESFETRVSRLMQEMSELGRNPPEDPAEYQARLQAIQKRAVAKAVFSLPASENVTAFSISGKRIGLYGDSLTAGFPCFEAYGKSLHSSLAEMGISVDIVGCGFAGRTASHMAEDLDSETISDERGRMGPGIRLFLDEHGPFDLLVILAGTNDIISSDLSAEEVLDSLKSLHRVCSEAGIDSVALSIPEGYFTGSDEYPEERAKWSAINAELASWSPFFVNSSSLIPFDDAAREHGLWEEDGLHPSESGYEQIGIRLAPVIAEHLQVPLTAAETGKGSLKGLSTSQVEAERFSYRRTFPDIICFSTAALISFVVGSFLRVAMLLAGGGRSSASEEPLLAA